MFWSKACKRCSGDVYLNNDIYGHYVSCIQCGAVIVDSEDNIPLASIIEILEGIESEQQPA